MMVSSDSIQGGRSGCVLVRGWRGKGMFVGVSLGLLLVSACGGSSKYFQDAVNEATQEMVGKRYGTPHKTQAAEDGGEVWTYFERGSGTAGFSGQVRGGGCRAYVLTFDKQAVLRRSDQQPCQG